MLQKLRYCAYLVPIRCRWVVFFFFNLAIVAGQETDKIHFWCFPICAPFPGLSPFRVCVPLAFFATAGASLIAYR